MWHIHTDISFFALLNLNCPIIWSAFLMCLLFSKIKSLHACRKKVKVKKSYVFDAPNTCTCHIKGAFNCLLYPVVCSQRNSNHSIKPGMKTMKIKFIVLHFHNIIKMIRKFR